MDGPGRMVPVTGSGIRIPGRMQAGRVGNGVTLSGLGSFLPRRWQGAGRAGACCSLSFRRSLADLHQPRVQRQPSRQQWPHGSRRKSTGRHAWSPEGWPRTIPHSGDITQEGVCSPAAPWEQAGPAWCPKLGSRPLSLCTDPPQFSPRPRTSTHRGGDERHEAQPRAPRVHPCVPRHGWVPSRAILVPAGALAEPSSVLGPGTVPGLQDGGHQGGFRTVPPLAGGPAASCSARHGPTRAAHRSPPAPALPRPRPLIANKS